MARIFSDQWGDFNGSIDDFRIYRKELNASEVSQLYGNGNGDFTAMDQQIHNDSYVSEWMNSSGNQRHAFSDFVEAPVLSYDLNTESKILSLDYGKKLIIPDAVSMPITLLFTVVKPVFAFRTVNISPMKDGDYPITIVGCFEDGTTIIPHQ